MCNAGVNPDYTEMQDPMGVASLFMTLDHITPSVRRCEKLAPVRPGRRNRLPHLACYARVCEVGGAGGFACRANFSHLLSEGTERSVPSLTLRVIWLEARNCTSA